MITNCDGCGSDRISEIVGYHWKSPTSYVKYFACDYCGRAQTDSIVATEEERKQYLKVKYPDMELD